MVIIQDGKLGNTEKEICKLDFGIEFGMPMNQSVNDVQPATGSVVGTTLAENKKCVWHIGIPHPLLTNLCQVGKSWPLSPVHLS